MPLKGKACFCLAPNYVCAMMRVFVAVKFLQNFRWCVGKATVHASREKLRAVVPVHVSKAPAFSMHPQGSPRLSEFNRLSETPAFAFLSKAVLRQPFGMPWNPSFSRDAFWVHRLVVLGFLPNLMSSAQRRRRSCAKGLCLKASEPIMPAAILSFTVCGSRQPNCSAS
jgi:hypothetical protein